MLALPYHNGDSTVFELVVEVQCLLVARHTLLIWIWPIGKTTNMVTIVSLLSCHHPMKLVRYAQGSIKIRLLT